MNGTNTVVVHVRGFEGYMEPYQPAYRAPHSGTVINGEPLTKQQSASDGEEGKHD